jgi:DNA-nicking Smr family endonuclease
MARRTKRGPSPEEKELWDRVARTATPLNRPKRHVPEPETPPKHAIPQPTQDRLPAFRIGEKATVPGPNALRHGFADRIAHAPVRMDHGTHRRMIKGKLKPEGRIDLHGMTLADAHPVLTRFIIDAYDDGKRLVLVITGKGKDRDGDGPIPIRRGVLRHQVPSWLHAPPLGALILDVRAAHLRHGGQGAYYVYLKRPR